MRARLPARAPVGSRMRDSRRQPPGPLAALQPHGHERAHLAHTRLALPLCPWLWLRHGLSAPRPRAPQTMHTCPSWASVPSAPLPPTPFAVDCCGVLRRKVPTLVIKQPREPCGSRATSHGPRVTGHAPRAMGHGESAVRLSLGPAILVKKQCSGSPCRRRPAKVPCRSGSNRRCRSFVSGVRPRHMCRLGTTCRLASCI